MKTSLLARLGKRLLKNGTPKRGAISRASEAMGLPYTTVRTWFIADARGRVWTPRKCHLAKIEDFLGKSVNLDPHPTGPKQNAK